MIIAAIFYVFISGTTQLALGPYDDAQPTPSGYTKRELAEAEKAIFDQRGSRLVINDNGTLRYATVNETLPALPLDQAVIAILNNVDAVAPVTRVQNQARLRFARPAIESAYADNQPKEVLLTMIDAVDVDLSDPNAPTYANEQYLQSIKQQIKDLPQWQSYP